MAEASDDVRREVWSHLKESQPVYLATAEAEQPRVRPVTLLDLDKKFWIATGAKSAKARQIRKNPNVEFCLPVTDERGTGYVRVSGVATIVSGRETIAEIGSRIPFVTQYWQGVDDPDFCLIRIQRVEVEYLRPGDRTASTFLV